MDGMRLAHEIPIHRETPRPSQESRAFGARGHLCTPQVLAAGSASDWARRAWTRPRWHSELDLRCLSGADSCRQLPAPCNTGEKPPVRTAWRLMMFSERMRSFLWEENDISGELQIWMHYQFKFTSHHFSEHSRLGMFAIIPDPHTGVHQRSRQGT